jgi:hypothetical protein
VAGISYIALLAVSILLVTRRKCLSAALVPRGAKSAAGTKGPTDGWVSLEEEKTMKKFAVICVALLLPASAIAQTTVVLPGEVRTYVLEQQTPSVVYEGEVVVGQPLPETVEIHTIPDQPDFAYAIVNEKRVIINPKTHTVVEVLQ